MRTRHISNKKGEVAKTMDCREYKRTVELNFLSKPNDWAIVANIMEMSIDSAKEALYTPTSESHKQVANVLDQVVNQRNKK